MSDYSGIYGIGYEDGNRLEIFLERGSLIRDELKNGNYDVTIVFTESHRYLGAQLLENVSLRDWRKFFVELSEKKIEEIERACWEDVEKSQFESESFDLDELDQLSFL